MVKPDYLIVGTGLAALSFASLMAKAGKRVTMIEAHEYPGGYGHTFTLKERYRFNAQLHYVWNCGPDQPIGRILTHLSLSEQVTFEQFDPDGFDRMRMPGYALDIPYDYQALIDRLSGLFPQSRDSFEKFIGLVDATGEAIAGFEPDLLSNLKLSNLLKGCRLLRTRKATLQDVFDHYKLPKEAQTLLALQWPDFLLPPEKLSFLAWTALFHGYHKGAYYPTRHFEYFVDSLVQIIEANGGEIHYNERVVDFILEGNAVTGVVTEGVGQKSGQSEYRGANTICNMDPKRASELIGVEKFSAKKRKQLSYDYSPSNFMAYGAVKGIDLRDHGFGKSNLFHTGEVDLNQTFHKMYHLGDYSKPSFALTVPTLITDDPTACPEGHQIIEILTVASYNRFLDLKISSPRKYKDKKAEILESIIDVIEESYVPNFREHLVFSATGSPTTNERYCNSPAGNSYGSNLTPSNVKLGRLNHESSLSNFYFCNASSGSAGFSGTLYTGARLYERLSGDHVVS